jgi:hypothetical protein
MQTAPPYFLLEQEGWITSSTVAAGLTAIRNANLNDKGRYYTGFFQMCIGIERLAKLALILDYLVDHSLNPPGASAVRSFGHDLITLFSKVEAIANRRNYSFAANFTLSPIQVSMLKFLADFAKGSRYANLDSLASGVHQVEPLHGWHQILQESLATQVPKSKSWMIENQSAFIASKMRECAVIMAHDLVNCPMSLEDWFSKPRLFDEASRFLTWDLIRLVHPIKDAVVKLSEDARQLAPPTGNRPMRIPYMHEFYSFLYLNRKYNIRKKKWP